MARTLADAFIRLRPQVQTREFRADINRAGQAAADDLQEKLRNLHLPIPNVEIGTENAARDIKVIESQLRDLARQSPDIEVDVNVAAALAEIKRFKTKLGSDAEDAGESAGRRATQGFNNKFDIGGSLFAKVAAVMASRMVLISAAVAGMSAVAAPAIGSLVQSIVQLSGLAATLPALLVAGGAGFAVLKIGTEGFFDAIKAGADSLDDLMDAVAHMPKGMADTAIAIDSFRERYEAMQTAIQTNLFAGIAGPLRELGNDLFPALENHLPAVASGFSVMAENLIQGARAGGVFKQGLNDALDSTAVGLAHANNNVGGLVKAFGKFLSVGAPFIERLGTAIDNLVFRLAQFINTSSDARITGWIEKSILVARQLGSIFVSVFSIIGSLVRAAGHDGESFLGIVARLTSQFAAFLKTTEGQGQIREFFDTVKGAVNGVGDVFRIVWPSIQAAGAALLPALQPLAKVLSEMLIAVAPLLPHFTGLGVILLTAILPVVQAVAGFFREHETAAKILATTILGLIIATKLYHLAVAAAALVHGIITFATYAWAAATGAQTLATNTSTAAIAGNRIGIIAHGIVTGIAKVATLAWAAAMWVLNAALSPIGLIVIAVVVVIGLLVFAIIKLWQHNETFRNIVTGAWNGIKAAVSAVVGWFVGEVWPRMQAVWNGVSAGAIWLWQNAILPAFNGIKAAVGAAWGWITNTGWPALQVVFTAVGAVVGWLWNNVVVPAFNGWRTIIGAAWGWVTTTGWPALKVAFEAVGTVINWLWHNVVVPAFQGIKAAFETAATVARNLWGFLGPVIGQIGTVILWLWNNVTVPAFRGIKAAFETAATVARNLWNILGPIIGQIATVVLWLWNNVVVPAFRGIKAAFETAATVARNLWGVIGPVLGQVATVVLWLWNQVVVPAFRGIKAAVELAWGWIVKTGWPALRDTFNLVKLIVTEAWNSFREKFDFIRAKALEVVSYFLNTVVPNVRTAFNNIRTFVTDLWNGFREKFDQIRDKVNTIMDGVKRAFQATKDAIKTTWEQIKEAVRTPINYVINPVYAKIKDFWNAIAGKIGIGTLPNIAQMAHGGVYPGYTPGRDIGFIGVSGGEAIMRPEWTRAVGPAWVDRANAAARSGGVSGAARFMGGYDDGGIVGTLANIGGFLKGKGEEFVLGSLLRIAEPVIKGIRGLINGIPVKGGGELGKMVKGVPTMLLDKAIEFIKSRDVAPIFEGGGGGSLGTGGASIDKIIALARSSKIPFTVGSTYRPGDPLYHGSRRAVDFPGYNQDRFAQFWQSISGALLELIHRTNSRSYGISNGKPYAPGTNNQLLNEHRNHVHVAMNGNATIGGPSGGAGGTGAVSAVVAGWIRTALAREGVSNWQGWMETLVKRESGGNRFAQSFSSNGPLGYAIGLAQLLASTFVAYRDRSLPNDRTDPIANLVASIRYIKARYGSIFSVGHANPAGRAAPGGYAFGGVVPEGTKLFDRGGWIPPGGFAVNGTSAPELATPDGGTVRLHPKDLKKLGEIIGSHMARAISTFGSATSRSADLIARS